MADQVFVAREQELGQLSQFLDRSLGSQGQVCFVSGEAGSGKTALITEFAQRAQERHGDLVVAIGQCDAYTGIGDPYLPFREVLCQLTGDVDAKLAQGAITKENASRLRKLVTVSGRVLVEVAPDLIGLFVPGAKIVGELGKAVAEKAGWMDKLEELAEQQKPGEGPGSPSFDQSQVFEQYTNAVKALSEKQPLLLILDDLHWADAGSTGLLFRLGRRIEESRIFIVGTYRPEEVALERAGERHPLQKVLAEFKRYAGERRVDLDRAREEEGKQFVDAVLATEPNRLSEEFRQVLFQHTKGHPLFTIELLRDMQERGALVQDDRGRWMEGPLLEWEELPDRVEGVIAERIERLDGELREILTVASVEGEDFTAEVVGQVRSMEARELVRRLSRELQKKHRLVRSRGVRRLEMRRLALYRFQHHLFQKYLYNSLDEAERAYLHQDVGNILEALYGDQADDVAVQLARHFLEAGVMDRAVHYLRQAGEQAAAQYANEEAVAHLSRALDALAQLPETLENRQQCVDTLIQRVALSWVAESPEETLGRLAEAERMVGQLPAPDGTPGSDRVRMARVHYWIGWTHYSANALPEAILYFSQVLPVAQEIGDAELLAMPSAAIGQALTMQGRMSQAEPLLSQALTALEQIGNREQWVRAKAFHGTAVAVMGDYVAGVAEIQGALASAREMGSDHLVCLILNLLAGVHVYSGDPLQAMEVTRESAKAAQQAGDRLYVYFALGWQACAESRAGLLEAAEASMADSQAIAEELGGRLLWADYFLAARAEMALGAGRTQEVIDLARQAVATAQGTGGLAGEALARRVWAQALAKLTPPQWDEAEAQFAESVRLIKSAPCPSEVARIHVAWGTVCRDRGDLGAAREHWEQASALWEACGITWELEKVLAHIATLPEG